MSTQRTEVESFDGLRIPVYTSGTGPPLLIVHGATANHEAWESTRPHLEDRLTVAIMDRRAHLEDASTPLALEDEFRDVVAVAASLGDDTTVLGHSSGALVVMGAALQSPKLARLVLYEPPPPDIVCVEPGPETLATLDRLDAQLREGDRTAMLDTWFDAMAGPLISDWDAWRAARHELEPQAASLAREMRALNRPVGLNSQAFADFGRPVLFLTGSKSVAFRAAAEPLAAAMTDLRVAEMPGQEHIANVHAPELVAQAVLDFVGAGATTR